MKKKIYIDIPTKVYYIENIYDYIDCDYPLKEVFENKFFYDKDTAYKYAIRKGLQEFYIEELTLGAINKDWV